MTARSRLLALALGASALLSGCAGDPDTIIDLPPCKSHCTTHTDGYEWAQRGNLSDPRSCEGYPEAFVRGCRNGVEDLQQLHPSSKGI